MKKGQVGFVREGWNVKKRMICLLLTLLAGLFLSGFSVQAEEATADPASLYEEQYEASGGDKLRDALPEETREWLESWGLDPSDPSAAAGFSAGNALEMIKNFLFSGGRQPLTTAAAVAAVILLCALFGGAGSGLAGQEMQGAFSYISTLAVGGVVLPPLLSTAAGTISAIQGCSVFMLTFVPIYAGILISAGKPLTAAGFQPLLLGAAQVVGQAAAFVLTPLTGVYLSVSMASAVAPGLKTEGLSEGIRKAATWTLTLIMTLFTGLLGIQTAIQGAADGLGMKTTRFLAGTFVPVVGGSISEALGTVQACLGLLKSTMGIYAVAALALLLLPVLIELCIWRLTLFLLASLCDLFDLQAASAFLRAVSGAAGLLTAILLTVGLLFIISAAIVSIAS